MAADEGFDVVLDRLRALVERLEQGALSLEDALRSFEEGVALARKGHQILDAAEHRVDALLEGGEEVPFGADKAGEP
jgi:exodeoxyribonuclease VII small subunit